MSDIPLDLQQVLRSMRSQISVLMWGLGITAGVLVALLATMITMSYQLGELSGQLSVLIGHVSLR